MKFDSDSLQDKLNHKIFYAKRVLPDNIYMLINISFTNMAYGQYQILKILLYILHPESSLSYNIVFSLNILINNYDISSHLSCTSCMLFLSIFNGDRLNFL